MKNITLSDIANKTGFSINTVSHALHDKPDISAKTKEYIKKIADEMGYIANVSASSLRSGKSKSIAIIVGDISNPHFSIMIKEMEVTLRKSEYSAIIFNTDEDEILELNAIKSAISKKVDGILICPVQKTHNNINFLIKNGIPFVLFGRRFDNISSNYIICDDINGGYQAAMHLIQKKHTKILFFNAPSYISSSKERLIGIRNAMKDSQLKEDSLYVVETDATLEKQETDLVHILTKYSDYNGIICFSDLMAMRICYHLNQMGKKIPTEVRVVGFDNIGSKLLFPIQPTSVSSSKTKMSIESVNLLMDLIINQAADPHQIILPTEVVQRDTT